MPTPIIIAIAGPSCSGKTLIAITLAKKLTDATVISMDSYYRDLTTVPKDELEHWNFDQPTSIDYKMLIEQLRSLAEGNSIVKPIYHFPSHTIAPVGEEITPGRYIILDGLFALYWQEVLEQCQLKVFIQASDEVCFQRRLVRDPVERGFTPEYVSMQYQETVRPMYQKFVHPTKNQADVVLNGKGIVLDSIRAIMSKLGEISTD